MRTDKFKKPRKKKRTGPKISIVVTARNDDHGGDFLKRMQIFIDALVAQAERFKLCGELIVVEWNPPEDRPFLHDKLSWPPLPQNFSIRIIQVPPAIHKRFKYSDKLALFQMIAKNIGIRRARGSYVLATNIDVLFSDSLMRFLASATINPKRMYRINRYDVSAHIPSSKIVKNQLLFCDKNKIWLNAKGNTYEIPDFCRSWDLPDALYEKIISLNHHLCIFRKKFLKIQKLVKKGLINRKWKAARRRFERAGRRFVRVLIKLRRSSQRFNSKNHLKSQRDFSALRFLKHFVRYLKIFLQKIHWKKVCARLPFARLIFNYVKRGWKNLFYKKQKANLHTNACGDFTLLSRDVWFRLRGYPEMEIFSIHLDSVFCQMAYFSGVKEVILRGRKKLYHIDHGAGWSPAHYRALMRKMKMQGVAMISDLQYLSWVEEMARTGAPLCFNSPDWGLEDEKLKEILISPRP